MKLAALGILTALATLTLPALAGERTSLADLQALPAVKEAESPGKTLGVPGITLKEQQAGRTSYYEITAAQKEGYCLVMRNQVFVLSNNTTDTDTDELWRLVEKDGGATLERTKYQVASYLGNVWVKSKSSVTLKPLATEFGVTTWGMRDTNGDLVVITPRATAGQESGPQTKEPGFMSGSTSSTCNYGAARIRASALKSGGGAAQLIGRLPAEGEGKSRVEPQFVVDISAIKVGRDPEPVISVRMRKALNEP